MTTQSPPRGEKLRTHFEAGTFGTAEVLGVPVTIQATWDGENIRVHNLDPATPYDRGTVKEAARIRGKFYGFDIRFKRNPGAYTKRSEPFIPDYGALSYTEVWQVGAEHTETTPSIRPTVFEAALPVVNAWAKANPQAFKAAHMVSLAEALKSADSKVFQLEKDLAKAKEEAAKAEAAIREALAGKGN